MACPAVPSLTVTLTTRVVEAPTASVPMVHSPVAELYAPLKWLLYCTCGGRTSVMTTPVAVAGPLFDATRVYAMSDSMSGVLSLTTLWTPTSATTTQLVMTASSGGCTAL